MDNRGLDTIIDRRKEEGGWGLSRKASKAEGRAEAPGLLPFMVGQVSEKITNESDAKKLRAKEYSRKSYLKHRDRRLAEEKAKRDARTPEEQTAKTAYKSQWYQRNKERVSATNKTYARENATKIKEYNAKRYAILDIEGREQLYNKTARIRNQHRIDALKHYSGGTMSCARCGFDDIRAISLDHVNGDGAAHRRQFKDSWAVFRWIKKNGYPEGFQVLCMNCQFIKRHENNEMPGKPRAPHRLAFRQPEW
jgi:glucan-binding YG repeat protein